MVAYKSLISYPTLHQKLRLYTRGSFYPTNTNSFSTNGLKKQVYFYSNLTATQI